MVVTVGENAPSSGDCFAVDWTRNKRALYDTGVPGLFGESGRELPLREYSLVRDG